MKTSSSSISLLLLLLLLSSIIYTTTSDGKSNADDHEDYDQDHHQRMKSSWIKSLMSVTETAFPSTSVYFEKGRVAIKMVHDFLFRPSADIDFRSSVKEGGGGRVGATARETADGGGGVGERVKEAASKSLEKSKATLEESAKLAGDTLHEVTDKVKSSFKKTDEDHHSQHEL